MKEENKLFSGISKKLSAYICPVMLGTAICYSVMSVLDENTPVLYSAIFLLGAWLLFGLFDKLKNMKRLGGLLYIVLFMVSSFVSTGLARMGMPRLGGFRELMRWFFGESDNPIKVSGTIAVGRIIPFIPHHFAAPRAANPQDI